MYHKIEDENIPPTPDYHCRDCTDYANCHYRIKLAELITTGERNGVFIKTGGIEPCNHVQAYIFLRSICKRYERQE